MVSQFPHTPLRIDITAATSPSSTSHAPDYSAAPETIFSPTHLLTANSLLAMDAYCCLCGLPCASPRLDIPLPGPRKGQLLAPPPTPAPIPSTPPSPLIPPGTHWLHSWQALQYSTGAVQLPISPMSPNNPQPFVGRPPPPSPALPQAGGPEWSRKMPQRIVVIHSACFARVEALVASGRVLGGGGGGGHEAAICLGWSLPRYTGWGPWVSEQVERAGYWAGTQGQRARWMEKGDHVLQADLVDPDVLSRPKPRLFTAYERPRQTPSFRHLPDHVIVQVAEYLLIPPASSPADPPQTPTHVLLPIPHAHTPPNASLPPSTITIPYPHQTEINSFLAWYHTCSQTYYADYPSSFWTALTVQSARHFTGQLAERWRIGPMGPTSNASAWIELHEDVMEPVKIALANVHRPGRDTESGEKEGGGEEGDGQGVVMKLHEELGGKVQGPAYSAQDVWRWWAFTEAWRSRRRIWTCVIHGTATARDADWW